MKKNLLAFFLVLFSCPLAFSQIQPAEIIEGNLTSISEQLRNLPTSSKFSFIKEKKQDERINKRVKFNVDNANAISNDGALQRIQRNQGNQRIISSPVITSFDGNSQINNNSFGLGLLPPDPVMAAGPNHVVQMINVCHSVYDKTGNKISGPTKFSSIAPGATDDGDPIVLYDNLADRWVLMQFSEVQTGSDKLIFCISKTADPAGAYYVYTFPFKNMMPDYPHIGVWNNSYLITTHEFNSPGSGYMGQGFYAIDRTKMIAGLPTTNLIRFSVSNDGGNLPASFEGMKTPEPNSPPMFFTWDSDETGAPADLLQMRTMNINFDNPALSSLSAPVILNTSSFDGRSPSVSGAIEQSGTTSGLDAIADRMMSRVIYRRFDDYESVVMNYTVNISGINPVDASTYQSAIRWYEMRRNTPASPWTIYQQSTYAPDIIDPINGYNSWMGSIGINQKGNIGIAYSRSGIAGFPDLYYAVRKKNDPLSTMGMHQVLHASGGSQTSTSNRWGDYSSMNIDPADEESLWFTGEYYASTSKSDFKTRIAKFLIDDAPTSPTVHFKFGGTIARQSEANTLISGSSCLRYKDYPITLIADQAPSQPVNITLNATGTATPGVDYDLIFTNPLILDAGNLSKQITLRIYDDSQNEPDEFIDLSYSINANGGNAIAADYNQKHRITIIGKPAVSPTSFITTSYGTSTPIFFENFDTVTTNLGAWTEQIVNPATGNINHFIVGTKGGAGFVNKALYISNNNDTIQYSGVSNGNVILRAISPVINALGMGQISVSFKFKCQGEAPLADFGSLWYSKDGGATWKEADPANRLMSNPLVQVKTINLPSEAENSANLKIAFQWQNDRSVQNQPPLGVDSVVVNAKPIFTKAAIQTTVNTGTVGTFNFGPYQTINFIDTATKKIMASLVNNSAFNFGCTKVEVDRAGTGAVNFNSTNAVERVASKTFKITPEFNNTSASYTLRLYYTQAEITGWETATGLSRNEIKIVKVNGNNSIQDVNPGNESTFNYSINNATAFPFGDDGFIYENTFTSGGFSGFGIGKPLPSIPLPITLLNFNGAYQKNKGNRLSWKVTNQLNVNLYELESSADGIHFTKKGSLTPINTSSINISYEYLDANYIQGNNYYRLKTIDNDGRFIYSSIVLINVNEKGSSMIVYPNPVKDILYVDYKGTSKEIKIEVTDASGKKVYQAKTVVNNPLKIPVHNLASGEYVLRIYGDDGVFSAKFIR